MELPFAVESSGISSSGAATAVAAAVPSSSSSLFHPSSNASSLVSTSSQGSLGKSNNENILYSNNNNNLHHHNNTTSTNMMMQMMSSNVVGFNPYHHNHHSNNNSGNLLHPQSVVLSAPSTTTLAPNAYDTETIDFTYVTVCEEDADEVDIVLDGGGGDDDLSPDNQQQRESPQGDVLTVLLSGAAAAQQSDAIVSQCEEAHVAANRAIESKKEANLNEALEAHARAAKLFKEAAVGVRETNVSLSNSLLLLSQNQAKAALVLKRILKQRPTDLQRTTASAVNGGGAASALSSDMSHKERLRAAVRGALGQKKEADMSDSVFLGRASSSPSASLTSSRTVTTTDRSNSTDSKSKAESSNPVDDMMELERELREMDMALELGNSIASLDARTMHRMKNNMIDGSFMMVAPGQSYMSSSALWSSGAVNPSRPATSITTAPIGGTASARARANHVQNVLQASSAGIPAMISHPPPSSHNHHPQHHHNQQQQHAHPSTTATLQNRPPSGLESSWWGNASTTSQVLASSVISLSTRVGGGGNEGMLSPTAQHQQQQQQPANTKQLMRLLDSLKTLGDENAALLREVEEAEAARMEAKAAREQMKRFKAEYGQRFAALKAALEKFRKGYPENPTSPASSNTSVTSNNGNAPNPVTSSDFFRTASATEQLQRQEQLIRKLTEDLKKEKSESRKKDAALRKYESFYREVKARSAQKAAQRQQAMQQPPQSSSPPPLRRPPNPR